MPVFSPVTHLLYLHGFRSSPQSAKALQVAARVHARHPAVRWWCPQLPPSPAAAWALVREGIAAWPQTRMAVVGSSLGGFYATAVAESTGCRAVVLNPAVFPARDLARYIGEQSSWHNPEERFFFRPEYVAELQALDAGPLRRPQQYLAVIAQGDELLDWREMQARYQGGQVLLLEGGDHALSRFDQQIDAVFDFLQLA